MYKNKKIFLSLLLFISSICFIYYANAATTISYPENNSHCIQKEVNFIWSNSDTDIEGYKLIVSRYSTSSNEFIPYLEEEFSFSTTSVLYLLLESSLYECKVITFYNSAGKLPDTTENIIFSTELSEMEINFISKSDIYCAKNLYEVNGNIYSDFDIEWEYSCLANTDGISVRMIFEDLTTFEIDTTNFIPIELLRKDGVLSLKCGVYYCIRMQVSSSIDMHCNFIIQDSIIIKVVETLDTPKFTNLSILDGANCESIIPVFKWQEIDSMKISKIKYFVEISETENFENIIDEFISTSDSVQGFVNKFNHTYYWRILALNEQTNCRSEYSAVRSFTTLPEPVVLRTPLNDVIGSENFECINSNGIRFTWENKNNLNEGEYHYIIQLSTSDLFIDSTIIVVDTITDENNCNFELILNSDISNKDIFWRVKALLIKDSLECESFWSEMRYFKAPYNTPNIIYPSSQEMCFRGNLPFKWNRVQGKVGYEIYLSEDKTFNDSTKLKIIKVDINLDSVFVDFDLKNETDYYWKIRAIDSINNSFFSPVSSFRTVKNTTILISPDDNTLGIATPISFVWEERLDASYRFQLSLHKDFSEILLDTNLIQGNLSINMKSNNTTYYWRVAVIPLSDVLCPSNFTEPFMFTTNLAAPILLNPENEVVLEKNEAFLIWEAVEAATKYELQIATDTNFTENLESFVNIINTSYEKHSLNEFKTYYWRVKALNESIESVWSNYFTFTTGLETPSIPILIEPIKGIKKVSITPTFVWRACSNANYYELEYATDPNFTKKVVIMKEIFDTVYTFTEPLDNYTLYYWRVRAINDTLINDKHYELFSAWSDLWTFRTINNIPFGKINLLEPVNNASELIWDEINLVWEPLDNADYYKLQISKFKEFNNFIVNSSKVSGTKYSTLRYLDTNSTYYWRVCGENEAGTSDWSDIWCFSTSHLLSIYNTNIFEGISLTPNPVYENINIEFIALHNIDATISIVNTQGIEVSSINGSYLAGNNIINLNVSGFTSGTYICYIMSGGKIIATSQFVVVK